MIICQHITSVLYYISLLIDYRLYRLVRYMLIFFFFFKQKTAYEMRISDWSSDVCSSDLLDLQEYFRWFVVHYWVEGVWEVIHITLVGFLLVLMFKVDIKSVGFAVFWGVALVWLSGLIGNAHHYFWIEIGRAHV